MEKTKTTAFSNIRNIFIRIVGLVICAAFVMISLPSAAEPITAAVSDSKSRDMEAQIAELNKQIEQLKTSISTTSNDIETALKEKERIDTALNLQIKKIELTVELIAELNGNIEQKDGEIADRESEYQRKYAIFKQRLRVTHEEGQTGYIEMLLGAKSLSELLARVDRVGAMLAYDTKIMEELKDEKSSLENHFDRPETSAIGVQCPHHGLDAACGKNLHGLVAQGFCLEDFAGLLNGDLAAEDVQGDGLAVLNMLGDALADDQRQTQVDAVAEENPGEAVSKDSGGAHVDQGDGGVFPAGTAAEVGSGYHDAALGKVGADVL